MNQKRKQNKKLVLISTLGILVFGMLVINELILRTDLNPSLTDRTPASEIYRNIRSGSYVAERKLASDLAEFKDRTLASLGHSANPFDQFRFGILEGKYALTVEGEKIKDVTFVDNPESEGSPTRISNRLEFLKQHAQILNILNNKIEKLATDIKGRKIIETYKAFLKDSHHEVVVKIEIDELDRLYNISVM